MRSLVDAAAAAAAPRPPIDANLHDTRARRCVFPPIGDTREVTRVWTRYGVVQFNIFIHAHTFIPSASAQHPLRVLPEGIDEGLIVEQIVPYFHCARLRRVVPRKWP